MDGIPESRQKEIPDEQSPPSELRAHTSPLRKVPNAQGQVHRLGDIREQCETRQQNPRRHNMRQRFQEVLQKSADTNERSGNRKRCPEHHCPQ